MGNMLGLNTESIREELDLLERIAVDIKSLADCATEIETTNMVLRGLSSFKEIMK